MPERRSSMSRMGRMGTGGRPTGRSNQGPAEHIGKSGRRLKAGIYSATVIDFVIDYSRSMRDLLPTIYIFCRDLVNACQLGSGDVRFGLTFLSEEVEKKTWKDEDFTTLPTDVLDGMLGHEVGGGSWNGNENIEQAVLASMKKLEQVPAGQRVMILFSDTPSIDKRKMNFKGRTALRSALIFVPTQYSGAEYLFDLVDAEGKADRSRTPFVFDIEEVTSSRYLKTGENLQADNEETRNQLLSAIS